MREDIQVIVVDDCSPGADIYKERYPELSRPYLEYYSTPIGGSAGRARNIGLDHAKGRWIIFADADDFFVDDFEHILNTYVEAEEDIIYFKHENVDTSDFTKKSTRCHLFNEIIERCGKDPHAEEKLRCCHNTPWSKMIKREFVERNGIRFDEVKYSNDAYFCIKAGCAANTVKAVPKVIYVLTERMGSLTSGNNKTVEELFIRTTVALHVQAVIRSYHFCYDFSASTWMVPQLYDRDRKKYRECIRLCCKYRLSLIDVFKSTAYGRPFASMLMVAVEMVAALLKR
jgi:glycosyltransferase involved in cell wall biosynthesis